MRYIRFTWFSPYFRHNNVFKDVYREVGILEVFVTCLNRYNEFLEKTLPNDASLDKSIVDLENGK
jgi:WD repeat and FYVE domain-containing protein 3